LEDGEIEKASITAIEQFLKPLGVARKRGQAYSLEINPKSAPLVAEFLSMVPAKGTVPLQDVYWRLRKGPFGLSRESFQALGLAMIMSGAISAYQGGRRLAPSQISYYRFWKEWNAFSMPFRQIPLLPTI